MPGRATVLAFAAHGAAVAASDDSEKAVHETARLIENQGGQVLPVLCDVTRSDDVAAAVATLAMARDQGCDAVEGRDV